MRLRKNILLLISILLCGMVFYWLLYPEKANSGPYLDSAHGNSTYGVNRTSISTFGYSKGNCVHCHEQHASIGGAEPNPTGGPDKYALFYTNHVSQVGNFCFKCHTDPSSFQSGGLVNRSYSYRAGGYTADTLNDILEAFSFTPLPFTGSSHNLANIQTLITGKSWGYSTDSNPCAACHNPHMAKGDPANSPNSSKSFVTRGYSPVSRPSLHSKDNNAWGLWGDAAAERMSNYTPNYQAPYRYNSTTTYEPDGSATTNGSNLTDYVTFCTDCHNTTNTIYSTTLGRNLKTIDWNTLGGDSTTSGDKHGQNSATTNICGNPPYNSTSSCTPTGLGKVLSCLDCHEPHGSPNNFLIRKEVNGGVLSGTVSTGTKDYGYLCRQCHMDDKDFNSTQGVDNRWEAVHHCAGDYPYQQSSCGSCHGSGGGKFVCGGGGGGTPPPAINCSNCHFHGSGRTDANSAPATRRTF